VLPLGPRKRHLGARFPASRESCLPGLAGLFLISLTLAQPVLAWNPDLEASPRLAPPRATLGQPFAAPVFLGAYGQLGGGFDHDQGQPGGGAIILFRPGSAVYFLDFLYDWNCSLVLQADYQKVSADSRILSGDLILRRHWRDMRSQETRVSPFLGAGIGGSEVTLPPGTGSSADQYWSLVVEFGQEWIHRQDYLVFVKGQLRHYSYGGQDFSTWSFQVGAGIPLPW
jgi:hypothetical protein